MTWHMRQEAQYGTPHGPLGAVCERARVCSARTHVCELLQLGLHLLVLLHERVIRLCALCLDGGVILFVPAAAQAHSLALPHPAAPRLPSTPHPGPTPHFLRMTLVRWMRS